MPTAQKNARVKASKSKKIVAQTDSQEESDHVVEVLPTKNKKPLEIDELEPATGSADEKIEEDPLVAAAEEDEISEEASIDGEELNPFGDRWEE
ncbi:MAG: hypothetical protein RL536_356 [Candidatus Parcubacteria bacterium]